MKQFIYNVFYYLVIPIILVIIIICCFNLLFSDLEKAVGATGTLVQSLAIIIGGLWAYHKFGWEKKAESAIKLKALLMDYDTQHRYAASRYQLDVANKKGPLESYINYSKFMLIPYNHVMSNINLSCYLPSSLRQKIFSVIWLTIGNVHGENRENLEKNWKIFGEGMENINKKLDEMVSK